MIDLAQERKQRQDILNEHTQSKLQKSKLIEPYTYNIDEVDINSSYPTHKNCDTLYPVFLLPSK